MGPVTRNATAGWAVAFVLVTVVGGAWSFPAYFGEVQRASADELPSAGTQAAALAEAGRTLSLRETSSILPEPACCRAAISSLSSVSIAGGRSDPPASRYGAGMAYDAKDGYVVLFGGYTLKSYLSDTWKFSGGVWTKLTPSVHPSARFDPVMTYDAADGYVVLFGGYNGTTSLNDTWTFSAGQWTERSPVTHPSARFAASFAFDPADNYTVLFGGATITSGTNKFDFDTWRFSGGAWTELHLGTHPSARGTSGLAYDAADGYLVLFGGCGSLIGFCGHPDRDTWKFVGGHWTNISSPGPSARGAPAMTYDAADGYLLLFGGANNSTTFNDTWTFLGGAWTEISPATHPYGLAVASITDDPSAGYVVLFGGYHIPAKVKDDTWSFVGGTWTKV